MNGLERAPFVFRDCTTTEETEGTQTPPKYEVSGAAREQELRLQLQVQQMQHQMGNMQRELEEAHGKKRKAETELSEAKRELKRQRVDTTKIEQLQHRLDRSQSSLFKKGLCLIHKEIEAERQEYQINCLLTRNLLQQVTIDLLKEGAPTIFEY